jgi:hypothetical protein
MLMTFVSICPHELLLSTIANLSSCHPYHPSPISLLVDRSPFPWSVRLYCDALYPYLGALSSVGSYLISTVQYFAQLYFGMSSFHPLLIYTAVLDFTTFVV